jgi:predicted transposase YbfD/YdcC
MDETNLIELNISSSLRKRGIEEEKVILQAAGAAKGGDNSLGEMIQELVAQKFEECKNDPNQFNAPYAYAKTRHMLDRYNYLLTLSMSQEGLEEEIRRNFELTTVRPVELMSEYFAIPNSGDRFSWAGHLGVAEATLMYDVMQIIMLRPGATLEQFNEKLADPNFGKLLKGLEANYNQGPQQRSPNRPSGSGESRPQESKSASSSGGGCRLILLMAALLICLVAVFVQ